MKIDLEYYKAFYHVARAGNLTHAAQALFISQPALTKRIRQMEELLGCALFIRLPKGMTLTPEGKELFPYAERACETLAAGENKLQSLLDLERGEVRIGSSDLILQRFLLPGLASFRERHPQIKITTRAAQAFHLLEDIRKERLDLAVVMKPLPPEMDGACTAHEIGEVRDAFIAGPQYAHLQGRVVPWDELLGLPLIALGQGTATRRFQGAFFHERGLEFSPMIELSTTVLIIPCVERGMGVGLVISAFAEESIAAGRAFVVKTPEPVPPRTVCVVTAKGIQLSRAARTFMAELLPQA